MGNIKNLASFAHNYGSIFVIQTQHIEISSFQVVRKLKNKNVVSIRLEISIVEIISIVFDL